MATEINSESLNVFAGLTDKTFTRTSLVAITAPHIYLLEFMAAAVPGIAVPTAAPFASGKAVVKITT